MALRCPICKKPVAERSTNPGWPFCSERCRLIDLGKWLDEDYKVPAESQEHGDDDGDGGERKRD